MYKLILLFLIVFLLLFQTPVFAEDYISTYSANIKKVDHIANIRERIQERINILFKFSPQSKIDYQKELTEKRFAELVYVIENRKGDFIEETTSRYAAYLGRLTEVAIKNKAFDKKNSFLEMLENHELVLEDLIKYFEANSGFWLLLKHDINSINIYSEQIQKL